MDIERWKRHFRDMAEGKLQPAFLGKYLVSAEQSGGKSNEPNVKFVTPVAQAVELAKSELKDSPPLSKDYKGVSRKRKSKSRPTVPHKKLRVTDTLS